MGHKEKALLVVESPTKIKTLKKFLGPDFIFESSLGHVRDLPPKEFGIDVDHDFEPKYEIMGDKKEVIQKLRKLSKEVDVIYLCPDPDREGEAIAWHIASILPPGKVIKRVTFNSITKDAVLDALSHPRDIDQSLVDAQQTRRLLDRIVGYKISPIITRKVQGRVSGGLSAGRVQSVALKLVVDREKEIEAFKPVEYWSLNSFLTPFISMQPFKAHVYAVDGKKVEKEKIEGKDVYLIGDEQVANQIVSKLKKSHYKVGDVEKKEKKRNPVPPFITSTLQQEASRHFGFSATRTMSIAQSLYEGVDLGLEGSEGLITYMRTDSVRVSQEALTGIREHILKVYGPGYLPQEARQFATNKAAQDAHEAIRPANFSLPPEQIRSYLSLDQFKLYQLIWRRFVASQMMPAIYDTVSCDIQTDENIDLRASGSVMKFNGFLAAYEEKKDEKSEEEEKILPPLEKGQDLKLLDVKAQQSFTKPPARFTEASLVKELEKSGIGRPSTYATIMNKIQSRDYTIKEGGALKPTELGRVIADMLEQNFKMIMDIGFTSSMEDDLEYISEHKKEWKDVIRHFWQMFIPSVEIAEKEAFVPKLMTELDCPNCGAKLQKVWSKTKYFYGCSGYPNCEFTAPLEALNFDKQNYNPDFNWEQKCPKDDAPMVLRHGKFGPFLGCENYPKCKGIVNIPKKGEELSEDLPDCVAMGCDGQIVKRRSRFGKVFYSCSNYPSCDVIVNDLSDLEEKYMNHPQTPYTKKGSKEKPKKEVSKGKKTSSKKEKVLKKTSSSLVLSPILKSIVGEDSLSRPQITKKLWDYIKENGCQDKKNKRLIVPDERLAELFASKEPLDMMQLAKVISRHIS
ncbi:MAG: type I DNA topoisomerase [Rhabdochlamydiaceae bacterium]